MWVSEGRRGLAWCAQPGVITDWWNGSGIGGNPILLDQPAGGTVGFGQGEIMFRPGKMLFGSLGTHRFTDGLKTLHLPPHVGPIAFVEADHL